MLIRLRPAEWPRFIIPAIFRTKHTNAWPHNCVADFHIVLKFDKKHNKISFFLDKMEL